MGSKKKRKSTAPAEEQPPKRPSSQQGRRSTGGGSGSSPLAWSATGVTVTLPADQALLFLGRARLAVQSGEVAAFGSIITAASGPVELCADERCGGPLLLEPGAVQGTVPLATSGNVVFTLTRAMSAAAAAAAGGGSSLPATPPSRRQQQQAEDGAEVSSSGSLRLGFEVYLASDPAAPTASLLPPLPPLWQQAAGEVEETLAQQGSSLPGAVPPVIVVCGAKKVGKSTFARFLANSLLNHHPVVAYMDTDCGQPEFTPPGLVSLSLLCRPVLGPPHMHLERPAAAFFVGDTSPANDPVRYLQYIRELYSWYRQHGAAAAAGAGAAAGAAAAADQQQQQQARQQLPPLIINTHGWVKGMGFDVLVELLEGLPVSHLIQIVAANPKKNLPPGEFWLPAPDASQEQQQQQQARPRVLQWLLPGLGGDQQAAGQQQQQPTMSETSARSAATFGTAAASDAAGAAGATPGGAGGRGRLHAVEHRALQWEALAQQCIDNCGLAAPPTGAGSRGATAGAAVAQAGADLGDRLAAAVPFEVDADDVQVQVMHSSVPASQLYYALNGAVLGLCTAPQQPPAASLDGLAAPPALPCLGLGIVRAADAKRRRLHILTAVPAEELERVEVLQLGRLELPASLLQTAAHMSPYLCLFSLSSMGTGAGAIKSRNNLLRQSQM